MGITATGYKHQSGVFDLIDVLETINFYIAENKF
jgi:hypothetical protein